MDKVLAFLTAVDLSTPVYLLTWVSSVLALWLCSVTWQDPASSDVGCVCQRLRRLGLIVVQMALMVAIIFGEEMRWVPWPPMIVLLVGLNLYYGASILAVRERIAVVKRRQSAGGYVANLG